MTVTVTIELNGAHVPLVLDDAALAEIAAAVPTTEPPAERSPYLTIKEAADYMRCKRQRIDDLLSQHRLSRVKEGRRTLVSRAELDEYVKPDAAVQRC